MLEGNGQLGFAEWVTSSSGVRGGGGAGSAALASPGLACGAGDAFLDVAADAAGDAFFEPAADAVGVGFLEATGDAAGFFFYNSQNWNEKNKQRRKNELIIGVMCISYRFYINSTGRNHKIWIETQRHNK